MSELQNNTLTPPAWPVCPKCNKPWILRRGTVFSARSHSLVSEWTWQRDCRDGKVDPVIRTENDPEPPALTKTGSKINSDDSEDSMFDGIR